MEITTLYRHLPWKFLQLERNAKHPVEVNWPSKPALSLETLERFIRCGYNLGVQLGEPSNDLVDIDLDSPEALKIADYFLPSTVAVFGRVSTPRAHRLYYCSPLISPLKFNDPSTRKCLLELRSSNQQTMIPPSVHPNGEQVIWEVGNLLSTLEPAKVDANTLLVRLHKLASASLLGRYWPKQGSRNDATLALSGALVSNSWSKDDVYEFIKAVCIVAKDEEVEARLKVIEYTYERKAHGDPNQGWPSLKGYFDEKIVKTVKKWLKLKESTATQINLEDRSLAEAVAPQLFLKIRYASDKTWRLWNGKYWQYESQNVAIRNLTSVELEKYLEKIKVQDINYLKKARLRTKVNDVLYFIPDLVRIDIKEFDTQPDLINLHNGVYNLTTFELLPHSPDYKLTKLANVAYEPGNWQEQAPLWKAFLETIIPDEETRMFLQRIAGYCLTGYTHEHVLFYLYGYGANGKTTFLKTLFYILGDYACVTAPGLLLKRKTDSHPTGIADLHGKRLAICEELPPDGRLDEAMLKDLTGSGVAKARFMYGNYFEFELTHKFLIAANNLLELEQVDEAISRRILNILFPTFIPKEKRDVLLQKKLTVEHSGIFNWALEGLKEYYRIGLKPPKKVIETTDAYLAQQDPIKYFVNTYLIRQPGKTMRTEEIHRYYVLWCGLHEQKPKSLVSFSLHLNKLLPQLGFEKSHTKLGTIWKDIAYYSTTSSDVLT